MILDFKLDKEGRENSPSRAVACGWSSVLASAASSTAGGLEAASVSVDVSEDSVKFLSETGGLLSVSFTSATGGLGLLVATFFFQHHRAVAG